MHISIINYTDSKFKTSHYARTVVYIESIPTSYRIGGRMRVKGSGTRQDAFIRQIITVELFFLPRRVANSRAHVGQMCYSNKHTAKLYRNTA